MKDTNDPLNIFNELKQMDLKNANFFESLTDEQKKQLQPYSLMRWASGCEGQYKYYVLQMINTLVNKDYGLIKTEDKELLWKLLSACGTGTLNKYSWIKPVGKKQTNTPKIDELILQENIDVNDKELNLIKKFLTEESLEKYCKYQGYTDKEIKDVKTEFKKFKRS